jgi:hypothetical protein
VSGTFYRHTRITTCPTRAYAVVLATCRLECHAGGPKAVNCGRRPRGSVDAGDKRRGLWLVTRCGEAPRGSVGGSRRLRPFLSERTYACTACFPRISVHRRSSGVASSRDPWRVTWCGRGPPGNVENPLAKTPRPPRIWRSGRPVGLCDLRGLASDGQKTVGQAPPYICVPPRPPRLAELRGSALRFRFSGSACGTAAGGVQDARATA